MRELIWKAKLLAAASGLVVLAALSSCSDTEAPSAKARGGDSKAQQPVSLARSDVPTYPSRIVNSYGITSTRAYERIDRPSLSDRPYDDRKALHLDHQYSFLGLPSVRDLVARSRLVVVGTVLTIGNPHFNSSDGGFWDPKLHDEPGITDIAADVLRDVTIHVEEVWSSTETDLANQSQLTFTTPAGQVDLQLAPGVAKQLDWPVRDRYVLGSPPEVDVRVGERAVFFLTTESLDGLYDGRYAAVPAITASHELAYKFSFAAGGLRNSYWPGVTLSPRELRDAASSEILGASAPPEPAPGVDPADPHTQTDGGYPPTEADEPYHTHGE